MTSHRVYAVANYLDGMGEGEVIGEAENEADAVKIVNEKYPQYPVCHTDFYDAVDAPAVYHVEADGTGAFGIHYAVDAKG